MIYAKNNNRENPVLEGNTFSVCCKCGKEVPVPLNELFRAKKDHPLSANLVDLKKEIAGVIRGVSNLEYQTLLELRYLCFKTWEQIAVQMGYGIDNIYKMHHKAMREIVVPETLQ